MIQVDNLACAEKLKSTGFIPVRIHYQNQHAVLLFLRIFLLENLEMLI